MGKKVQTKKLISQEYLSTKGFLLRVHEEKNIKIDIQFIKKNINSELKNNYIDNLWYRYKFS